MHRIHLTFCKGNSKIAAHVLLNFVGRATEKYSDVLNASVFELLLCFHRGPEHFVSNKNKCTVIYLCPCVFFEFFRRDFNEVKAVSCNVVNYLLSLVNISHLPL